MPSPGGKQDRAEVSDQVSSIARGSSDLARQLAEFDRRLGFMEGKIEVGARAGAVERAPARQRDRGAFAAGQPACRHRGPARRRALSAARQRPRRAAACRRRVAAGGEGGRNRQGRRCGRVGAAIGRPIPAFSGLDRDGIIAAIRAGIEAQRIDLHLQPIVTLPQRKVRYYEAMSRLNAGNGEIVAAADFLPYAEAGSLLPKLDSLCGVALRAGGAAAVAQEPRHRPVLQSFAARP